MNTHANEFAIAQSVHPKRVEKPDRSNVATPTPSFSLPIASILPTGKLTKKV